MEKIAINKSLVGQYGWSVTKMAISCENVTIVLYTQRTIVKVCVQTCIGIREYFFKIRLYANRSTAAQWQNSSSSCSIQSSAIINLFLFCFSKHLIGTLFSGSHLLGCLRVHFARHSFALRLSEYTIQEHMQSLLKKGGENTHNV